MKKFLSFVFALCFLPFAVVLSACGHEHTFGEEWKTSETHHWHEATCEHTEEKSGYAAHNYTDENDATCNTCNYQREVTAQPTNAELAAMYKDVAVALWDSAGITDPTAQTPALLSAAVFPELNNQTTEEYQIENINGNAATTGALFYMISLLYENADFYLTNGIAIFDAVCTLETSPDQTMTINYTFTVKPTLDLQNNKVSLEIISDVVDMNSSQYSFIEMNFNFETKTLISYNFYSWVNIMEGVVGMGLTEDGNYLYTAAQSNADEFAVAVINCKDAFVLQAAEVQKLTANFDAEMQVYFDALNDVLAQIHG